MNQRFEADIQACEKQLETAMLNSDVEQLDSLLSSDLIFTNHFGHIVTKEDDLKAHSSGVLKIEKMDISDQKIKMIENIGIVTVQAKILGSFAGESSENIFRFTRIWNKATHNTWQVIAAHSCLVK